MQSLTRHEVSGETLLFSRGCPRQCLKRVDITYFFKALTVARAVIAGA